MSDRICAVCDRDPSAGHANYSTQGKKYWLCHGDGDKRPTCYERFIRRPFRLDIEHHVAHLRWEHKLAQRRWEGEAVPEEEVLASIPEDPCHCGRPVHVYEDGFTRGLCAECSTVRCDVGPCPTITAEKRSS